MPDAISKYYIYIEASETLSGLFNIYITRKMVPIKKRAGGHSIYFSSSLALLSSSLALLSSLLSCSFYLLDQRTISGVRNS